MVSVRSRSACLLTLVLTACGGSGGKLPLLPPDSSLTYDPPPAFTVSVPITPVVPTHNVYLTNFSIVPDLPAGLVLDPGTGVISGTPTQASAATRYTVSVPDGTVALTATLVITVNPVASGIGDEQLVLDLDNNRVLSRNANSGVLSAPSNGTCSPAAPCNFEGALAGPTLVIRQHTGWDTYSSMNGALIAHFDVAPGFAAAWSLATDGSYLLFAGVEGVQATTPQGATLFVSLAPDPLSGLEAITGDPVWFDAVSPPRQ